MFTLDRNKRLFSSSEIPVVQKKSSFDMFNGKLIVCQNEDNDSLGYFEQLLYDIMDGRDYEQMRTCKPGG